MTPNNFAVFYCHHCLHPPEPNNLFGGTIEEVYDHWLTTHADATISKPFQFQAVAKASCLHCDETGTYRDLENHHKMQHKHKDFVITDRLNKEKCGICQFEGENVVKHYKAVHKTIYPPIQFNPIAYPGEKIAQLLAINIKKDANHTELSYLYCGYCSKKINADSYFNHFTGHPYSFRCSKCKHESDDVAELVYHERSLHGVDNMAKHCKNFPNWLKNKFLNATMVFTNGLILKGHNAPAKLGDGNILNKFIKDYLNARRECLNRMTKTKEQIKPKGNLKEPDDDTKLAELIKQLKLDKVLYIGGIFGSLKKMEKDEIFSKLCEKLNMNIRANDVKQILMYEKNGMIVEFPEIQAKRNFMDRIREQPIWSDELCQLSANETKWPINARHHFTPFYRDIETLASKLKRENKIHAYWIDSDGFIVKRKASEQSRPILSVQQLQNYVNTKDS